ncbi:hypothetical protein FQZ97_1035660 [compost metagenome]
MQKNTRPAMYRRGSRSASPKWPRVAPDSLTRASVICRFSSSLSQRACSGRSVSQNQPNSPSSTAGAPVRMNSICQSRRPAKPSRWVMIAPDSGPQTIPATIPAMMKAAVMRPRRAAGNQ